MKNKKRAQVGIEYMIIVGFVTVAIMSIVILAYFYSNQIKDRIRLNQVENFASQLISSCESVFFAGEPSKSTIKLYLPDGVENIEIDQNSVIVTTRVSAGLNVAAFDSNVELNGTITNSEGIKRLVLDAKQDFVQITQG